MRAAALLLSLAAAVHAQEGAVQPRPVQAEFRIFSGTREVTASTRLRVMPTGKRDQAMAVANGKTLATAIPPGIYDVQALLLRNDAVVGIKWAERLVIMYYPDEDGRHLEVINFEPGFGALQVRGGTGATSGYEVVMFPVGDRSTRIDATARGEDYRLFVLPAGRYDLRVRPAGAGDDSDDARWFLDIEVPADRTRMKSVGSDHRIPTGS